MNRCILQGLFQLFITLILTLSILGNPPLEIKIPNSYSLIDQFGSKQNLSEGVQGLLFAHTFREAKMSCKYLNDLDSNFLKDQKIHFIVDLSSNSDFMRKWYYLPKLKKYDFSLLIGHNDTFMASIPRQSNKLTFIEFNRDQSIREISFRTSISEMYSRIVSPDTSLKIGEYMSSYKLADQFGKCHQLTDEKKYLLIANEMQVAKKVNTWLSTKNASFLDDNHAAFIAEISDMPTAITKMFALPKMREYQFPILLAYDKELGKKGLQKIDSVTILELGQESMIKDIRYASKPEEFENLFKKPGSF